MRSAQDGACHKNTIVVYISTFVFYIRISEMARTSKTKPKGWHPADIRAELAKRGKTLTGLALESGLDSSACRAALIRSLPNAEMAISRFLGVPLHELWPDRWDADGRRYRHVRVVKYHGRDQTQRQNPQAA